jgi:hypothetical protein
VTLSEAHVEIKNHPEQQQEHFRLIVQKMNELRLFHQEWQKCATVQTLLTLPVTEACSTTNNHPEQQQ